MPAPGEKSKVTSPVPAPTDADWSDTITLTEALVFRYSAVTWNAHRIHYDADYSRDEEGYPATVQNGGLTMTLLSGAALKRTSNKLLNFNVRLTRPIHVGDTVNFCGSKLISGSMKCWVSDKDGAQCGLMELGFEE
jgi:3-methylfumaryl-CoA hydratase